MKKRHVQWRITMTSTWLLNHFSIASSSPSSLSTVVSSSTHRTSEQHLQKLQKLDPAEIFLLLDRSSPTKAVQIQYRSFDSPTPFSSPFIFSLSNPPHRLIWSSSSTNSTPLSPRRLTLADSFLFFFLFLFLVLCEFVFSAYTHCNWLILPRICSAERLSTSMLDSPPLSTRTQMAGDTPSHSRTRMGSVEFVFFNVT